MTEANRLAKVFSKYISQIASDSTNLINGRTSICQCQNKFNLQSNYLESRQEHLK